MARRSGPTQGARTSAHSLRVYMARATNETGPSGELFILDIFFTSTDDVASYRSIDSALEGGAPFLGIRVRVGVMGNGKGKMENMSASKCPYMAYSLFGNGDATWIYRNKTVSVQRVIWQKRPRFGKDCAGKSCRKSC